MRETTLVGSWLVAEFVGGHVIDGGEGVLRAPRQHEAQRRADGILYGCGCRSSGRGCSLREAGRGAEAHSEKTKHNKTLSEDTFHGEASLGEVSINPRSPCRHPNAGLYENIVAKISVSATHHAITMANDVPVFALPVVANPIAVSTKVQSRKTSTCDAMKYQNGFSAGFMKYAGFVATGLFRLNPSAFTPASTEIMANTFRSAMGKAA